LRLEKCHTEWPNEPPFYSSNFLWSSVQQSNEHKFFMQWAKEYKLMAFTLCWYRDYQCRVCKQKTNKAPYIIAKQHSLDTVKAYPEMRKMQGIAFFVDG
jgi:hypothetical protein